MSKYEAYGRVLQIPVEMVTDELIKKVDRANRIIWKRNTRAPIFVKYWMECIGLFVWSWYSKEEIKKLEKELDGRYTVEVIYK